MSQALRCKIAMSRNSNQDIEENPYQSKQVAPMTAHELCEMLSPPKPAPVGEVASREMSRFATAQGKRCAANAPTTITVEQMVAEIKGEAHRAACELLRSPDHQSKLGELDTLNQALIEEKRATQDSAERAAIDKKRDKVRQQVTALKEVKHKLPAVTFSAVCENGHAASDAVAHTGFYQVDIDLKNNEALQDPKKLAKLRSQLRFDLAVAAGFTSPSGGLKVLVAVDKRSLDEREHKQAWRIANEYVRKLAKDVGIDLSCDDACSDVSRLCFLSHDAEAWMTEGVVALSYTEPTEQEAETPRKAHDLQAPTHSTGSSAGLQPMAAYNQSNDFEELLRGLNATKTRCGGWLRDGGTSPRSASWNGKTLHVFSDAFEPFEPSGSYTPADIFAVCVLGLTSASDDLRRVTRELSKLGYGAAANAPLAKEDRVSIEKLVEKYQTSLEKEQQARAAVEAAEQNVTEEKRGNLVGLVDTKAQAKENFTDENLPAFFQKGALAELWKDIYQRSNPRNHELVSGGAIASMAALIGQNYRMVAGPYDKRANSQVVMLSPSGAGKDAPLSYFEKLVTAVYGHHCGVTTYFSPTVVQSKLKKTGYCFETRDEAGDLLKAINKGGSGNAAIGQIGAMIKTLKTSAHKAYRGFTGSALQDVQPVFYCPHNFYMSLSAATPGQYLAATGDNHIEGGYWGRVLLFNVENPKQATNPRLIQRPPSAFSSSVQNYIGHFASKIETERKAWEAAASGEEDAIEYEPEFRPDTIITQDAAIDYLFEVSEQLKADERSHDDNDQLGSIASRLQEQAYELLLIYTVSRWLGERGHHTGKAIIATVEDAKICWEFAKQQHETKLEVLRIQSESVEEQIEKHVARSCERNDQRTMLKGALKTYISRKYQRRVTPAEMIEYLADTGKYEFLPNQQKPHAIVLKHTD
jgi:hypothetical protein